jgi:hypothetical protein
MRGSLGVPFLCVGVISAQSAIGVFALQPPPCPLSGIHRAVAYDAVHHVAVALHGGLLSSQTWEFASTWTHRGIVTPTIADPKVAWDPVRQRIVAVGDNGAGVVETWEYDGSQWTQSPTTAGIQLPASIAYDPLRSVLVLFGSTHVASTPCQTWERAGTTWTFRTSGGPGSRFGAGLVWSPMNQGCLLFAGYTGTGSAGHGNADTWLWNGTWQQLSLSFPYGASTDFASTLDEGRQRVWMFGGRGLSNQVTEWDGTQWTVMPTRFWPWLTDTAGGVYVPDLRAIVVTDLQAAIPGTWFYRAAQSTVVPLGAACAGAGVPAPQLGLTPLLPYIGSSFAVRLGNVPAGALPLLAFGDDRPQWNGLALPVDLSPLGATGCSLQLAPLDTLAAAPAGGAAVWTITVPNNLALIDLHLRLQAGVFAAGVNAAGVLTSNALTCTFGVP